MLKSKYGLLQFVKLTRISTSPIRKFDISSLRLTKSFFVFSYYAIASSFKNKNLLKLTEFICIGYNINS